MGRRPAPILVWVVGLNFLAYSFKYKNIAVASVPFVLFNVVSLALVGRFHFNERLSLTAIIGIGLGIVAIALLETAAGS